MLSGPGTVMLRTGESAGAPGSEKGGVNLPPKDGKGSGLGPIDVMSDTRALLEAKRGDWGVVEPAESQNQDWVREA